VIADELAGLPFDIVDDPEGARQVVGLRLRSGVRDPGRALIDLHRRLTHLAGYYGVRSVDLPFAATDRPGWEQSFGARVRLGRPVGLLRLGAGVLSAPVGHVERSTLAWRVREALFDRLGGGDPAPPHPLRSTAAAASPLSGAPASAARLSGTHGPTTGPSGAPGPAAGFSGVLVAPRRRLEHAERDHARAQLPGRHPLPDHFGGTAPGLGEIARWIAVHPRTLQRALAEEGLSFGQILDCVRRQRAHDLVTGTDLPFAAVSARLGFAEPAVLTRCARRWWGRTPSEVRASAAPPASTHRAARG
jgi:AraC-like DNA-binding protein